eukprot:TRINITY_DN21239_c0_g1_i1.p1 TRINITY_DN21239_c0_g1~~TRINITY_DN21239_c0_g1_i1.p1  ORF type:complete len:436 (+),score=76.37 TRINITY_DN21239_c0_g1_i1:176-1483(+)
MRDITWRPPPHPLGCVLRWCFVLSALGTHGVGPLCAGGIHVPLDAMGSPGFWLPAFSLVGLMPNATIKVQLQTDRPRPNAQLVLLNEQQLLAVYPHLVRSVPTTSSYLPCTWRESLMRGYINETYRISGTGRPSRYWMGILQAWPGAAGAIDGDVWFTNPDGDELPVQRQHDADMFLYMANAFGATLLWGFCLIMKNKRGRSKLHAFMLVNILWKMLVLLLIRYDLLELSRTGEPSPGRTAIWELMRQIQLVMEMVLLYVLGLGWKVLRSTLRPSEQAFAVMLTFILVSLGGLQVMCDTFLSCNNASYSLTKFTLHTLCLNIIIIKTNFNMFTIHRQITEALATPGTGVLYSKYNAFWWFRSLFMFYVVVPSLTSAMSAGVISWTDAWLVHLVREGSLWIIYTSLLWLFRPGPRKVKVLEIAVVDSSGSDGEDGA